MDGLSGSGSGLPSPVMQCDHAACRPNRKRPHRLLDVLDLLRPEVGVGERQYLLHLLMRGCRQHDATGISQRLQPRGDIDAGPEQIVATHHHITDVDADAEQDAPVLGDALGSRRAAPAAPRRRTARHSRRSETRPARCRLRCWRCDRDAGRWRRPGSPAGRPASASCRPRPARSAGENPATSAASTAASLRSISMFCDKCAAPETAGIVAQGAAARPAAMGAIRPVSNLSWQALAPAWTTGGPRRRPACWC